MDGLSWESAPWARRGRTFGAWGTSTETSKSMSCFGCSVSEHLPLRLVEYSEAASGRGTLAPRCATTEGFGTAADAPVGR